MTEYRVYYRYALAVALLLGLLGLALRATVWRRLPC
jgi:hypothetical protein